MVVELQVQVQYCREKTLGFILYQRDMFTVYYLLNKSLKLFLIFHQLCQSVVIGVL